MDEEFISTDSPTAEVAALQHEIYELNRLLDAAYNSSSTADDPFHNPTDYENFTVDYSEINPDIKTPGYRMPLEPEYEERRNLRKTYSVGGWCMLLHSLLTFGTTIIVQNLLVVILQLFDPSLDAAAATKYASGSSMFVCANLVIYLLFNIIFALVGLQWGGFKGRSIIGTRDYSLPKALQYCAIAFALWNLADRLTLIGELILSKFGYTLMADAVELGETPLAVAVSVIYICIVAPITEELLFRGMLLRVFSKANQRFAIFAAAFFFGIAHGNIPQFILAFMLGIFLAHITMKHDSIIPAVVVHIFINSLSLIYDTFLTGLDPKPAHIVYLIMTGITLFGLLTLALFMADNRMPTTTPEQSTRGLYVAASSLPFMLAAILDIAYIGYTFVINN